jgi:DNA repair exonuclease SbcCD ATPase subunit
MPRKFWLSLVVATACGCGASGPRPVDEQPQEMLGKPPTPEDDPFFYAVRPPESARAETTGTIGDTEDETKEAAEAKETAEPKETRQPDETAQAKETREPAESASAEASVERSKVTRPVGPSKKEYEEKLLRLEQKLADEEARALQLKTANLELQSRIDSLQQDRSRAEDDLSDERERIQDLTGQLEAARRELAEAREARTKISDRLEQARRERAQAERERAEAKQMLARAKEARAKERAPSRSEEKESRPEKPNVAQCYSCVQICPLEGKCADDAEMVCGWGTAKRVSDARRRARAECDGTLERLRATEYRRIEGACPAATCP